MLVRGPRVVRGLGKVHRLHCGHGHDVYDARSNRQHCWMTERWARRLIREHEAKDRPVLVKTFKKKMRSIGMKPD